MAEDYNSSANIRMTNNFSGNANIKLSHQYSDDPVQNHSWASIAPGATPADFLVAGYSTGFLRTGQDHWQVTVNVLDGTQQGTWASNSHQCTLSSEDNGKTLTFSVSPDAFLMVEISGTCSTGWAQRPGS